MTGTPLTAALVRRVEPFSALLTSLAVILGGVLTMLVLTTDWAMTDGAIYREAAERLRDGEPLYPPLDPSVTMSYRYAPWFAYVWLFPIPDAAWLGLMAACAIAAVVPALRAGRLGVAIGAVVFPYLLLSAMGGNVHPAMIAILVYGLPRRWGPVAIATAASLKAFPLLYVFVYVARRQWIAAAVTLLLTAVLTAPMLAFDLSKFPTETAGSWGPFTWSPILWAAVVLGLTAYVLWRPSWFGASLLVMLARTKFVYYDVAYLLVGHDRNPTRAQPPPRGRARES